MWCDHTEQKNANISPIHIKQLNSDIRVLAPTCFFLLALALKSRQESIQQNKFTSVMLSSQREPHDYCSNAHSTKVITGKLQLESDGHAMLVDSTVV